ncbi:hypothetical protein FisN_15Lh024 [Fistulifera solaris]|uniref:Uncharacterized protein n=1 Tax=Fistulifera solaris TaxID=1519565 RepID=A0A1Z5KHE8_FISSO|nr:hypothetical protein FisN_15Lh024 [Fistulifera solaris]|eukprot:GAX25656.1 hypothetical protein FisN_15Lh024 [Fistulifera solaris]
MKHPKKLWNLHRKTWTREDLRTRIDEYLQFVAKDQPKCKNVLRGGSILLQCSCLATNLTKDDIRERVADYLLDFLYQTTRKDQTVLLTHRIQQSKRLGIGSSTIVSNTDNADREHCKFALPGEEEVMICSSALLTLLGFSRHVWAHCLKCADDCKHVDDKIMPQHGARRSNSGNALDESIAAALETFFEHQLTQAEMHSTSSNSEEDSEDTEPSFVLRSTTTKKGLYELFCHERGWELVKSLEGSMKAEPLDDMEQQPICSLSSFLAYWKKNYPQLDVPFSRRSSDILLSPEQQTQFLSPAYKKRKTTDTDSDLPTPFSATPRRSFAETTNLHVSPRTLWETQNNQKDEQQGVHKQMEGPNREQPATELQSHNQYMQRELKQCQEQLAQAKEANQRLSSFLLKKDSDVANEKEKNRRLSNALQKKDIEIERLEAENKHLQAAIALFRVNLPAGATVTEPTVSANPLKRKAMSTPFTSRAEANACTESRDEVEQDSEEQRRIAIEIPSPRRVLI